MKKLFICTALLTSWLAAATDLLTDRLIAEDDFIGFGFAVDRTGHDIIFELSASEINIRPIREDGIPVERYDSHYFSHVIADEINCKYNCESKNMVPGSEPIPPHHGDGVFFSNSSAQAIFLANKTCYDFRANNMSIYGNYDTLAPYFHVPTTFSSLTDVDYYVDQVPVLKPSHSDPNYKILFTLQFKCAFKL